MKRKESMVHVCLSPAASSRPPPVYILKRKRVFSPPVSHSRLLKGTAYIVSIRDFERLPPTEIYEVLS